MFNTLMLQTVFYNDDNDKDDNDDKDDDHYHQYHHYLHNKAKNKFISCDFLYKFVLPL